MFTISIQALQTLHISPWADRKMSENSRKRPRESADAGSPSPQQRSAPSEAAPKKVPVAAVASSSSSSTTSHVVSVANVEVNPISVDEHKGKAQNTLQSLLQIQQAMEYIYSKRKEMGDTVCLTPSLFFVFSFRAGTNFLFTLRTCGSVRQESPLSPYVMLAETT